MRRAFLAMVLGLSSCTTKVDSTGPHIFDRAHAATAKRGLLLSVWDFDSTSGGCFAVAKSPYSSYDRRELSRLEPTCHEAMTKLLAALEAK